MGCYRVSPADFPIIPDGAAPLQCCRLLREQVTVAFLLRSTMRSVTLVSGAFLFGKCFGQNCLKKPDTAYFRGNLYVRSGRMSNLQEATWMKLALEEGERARQNREVPVGCVLVSSDGKLLGKGSNRCNEMRDGTQHAELVARDDAVSKLGAERFRKELEAGIQLYVTCEPCIMCAAALLLLGVKQVYYGCRNEKFGGCGSVKAVHNGSMAGGCGIPVVKGGLFEKEAIELLQQFYMTENRSAPQPKKKRRQTESGQQ